MEPGTKIGMNIIDIMMREVIERPRERHHVGSAEIAKGFPFAAANGASSKRGSRSTPTYPFRPLQKKKY
jgi:hypothetical protein